MKSYTLNNKEKKKGIPEYTTHENNLRNKLTPEEKTILKMDCVNSFQTDSEEHLYHSKYNRPFHLEGIEI